MSNITILGAGAWGTAMARLCYQLGHQVTLWCHETCVKTTVPDCPQLTITRELTTALQQCDYALLAIPVPHLRPFLNTIALRLSPAQIQAVTWVSLAKGLEQETLLLPSQIVTEILAAISVAVLAGPSFASELLQQQPTGVMIASPDLALAQQLCALFNQPTATTSALTTLRPPTYFYAQPTTDLVGVQLCSALKNVYALGLGILAGAGYGANTRALFLTHSLNELTQLVTHCGGQQPTVYGLAGLGDLVLTAYSLTSRNTQVGYQIGQGQSLAQIQRDAAAPATAEGLNTLLALRQFCRQHQLELPLCSQIDRVVHQQAPPASLVNFS